MKRLDRSLRNALTGPFVTFVGGVLVSILVRALFGQVIPLSQGIAAIFTVAFVVLAIAALVGIRLDIRDQLLHSRLLTKVYHASRTPRGDTSLYDPVIDIIRSAEESLRAISLYRPPSLPESPGRQKYYQALNDKLEAKHKRGEPFVYERILQVAEVMPGELHRDQVDPLTFEHCERSIALKRQKTSLTIHLRQVPDVLGALSFLIVDDKEIVFGIPSVAGRDLDDPRALSLGTGVVFTDLDGQLAKEMLALFRELQLGADADEIVNTVPSATS